MYYPSDPVNVNIQYLLSTVQEKNWVLSTKKWKDKLPLFCGNGERVIPIDVWGKEVVDKILCIFGFVSPHDYLIVLKNLREQEKRLQR